MKVLYDEYDMKINTKNNMGKLLSKLKQLALIIYYNKQLNLTALTLRGAGGTRISATTRLPSFYILRFLINNKTGISNNKNYQNNTIHT
jgi:hypothetical protein